MIKITKQIILFFSLILSLTQCSTTDPDILSSNGTVKYISLEGGFYGIITDANEPLDPVNLSKEFQKDGMRVTFSYKIKKDAASFHMWGQIIELIEIKEL